MFVEAVWFCDGGQSASGDGFIVCCGPPNVHLMHAETLVGCDPPLPAAPAVETVCATCGQIYQLLWSDLDALIERAQNRGNGRTWADLAVCPQGHEGAAADVLYEQLPDELDRALFPDLHLMHERWDAWRAKYPDEPPIDSMNPADTLSEALYGAVLLGSSGGSWSYEDDAGRPTVEGRRGMWTCARADLTDTGRAVVETLDAEYGSNAVLLTFLDT